MRVALFHNSYVLRGGEDVSTATEALMLRQHGAEIFEFKLSNAYVMRRGTIAVTRALARSHFNERVYEKVRAYCRRIQADVAHVENFWFAMSPSVHAACHAEGVPTVQSIRNFRLLCVGDLLLRDGKPCNDCVGRSAWAGVRHRCKNDSLVHSMAMARMIQHNRKRGTWENDVDVFIASTNFVKSKLVEGGLPAAKIVVMPNFVADAGMINGEGHGATFVGRLSQEKGLHVLLEAWKEIDGIPLRIIGDGPLRRDLEAYAVNNQLTSVTFMGHQPHQHAIEAVRQAEFLVMPSIWYEGFGRIIIEAFSTGRPVIASNLGSMAEIVEDGKTGLLFDPGNPSDLAQKITWMRENAEARKCMGMAARREYEAKYTPERNFQPLVDIYEQAIHTFSRRTPA